METGKKNAFVVWIDPAEGPAGTAERYQGRVEHVPTSTREPFASKEELLAFIERYTQSEDDGGSSGGTP